MSARDAALIALDRLRLPGWRSNLISAREQRRDAPTDPRDLALAEQIRVGVVKNVILLQHLITHYSGRSLKSIDPLVQKILAIGLYQLRFLNRIPPSAAVDEAVEQTRRFGRRKASGFVNAVLRRATREPAPPLPARDEDPAEYARLVLSHPPELVERLMQLLGPERMLAFAEHDNREPPTLVRLFAGIELSRLQAEDVRVTPHEQPGMYVVEHARQATLAAWSKQRIAQVQDATAAAVIKSLDLRPGQTVIDRCAGMGTKTMQLRERIGESGRVIAMEPAAFRFNALVRQIEQHGFANVQAHQAAWLRELPPEVPRQFERALIDAPCSNSGVLSRRPEARYHQSRRDLQSLHKLQLDILRDAAAAVAPGGILLYSTCSVWPEENEQIVRQMVSEHPQFAIEREQTTWPSFDDAPQRYRDGGYVAVLRCN
jgi:16S rRNA (cytosine967-C5)-methyltransferase